MMRPSCNSRDLNAETIVGLLVWSPELIPGMADTAPHLERESASPAGPPTSAHSLIGSASSAAKSSQQEDPTRQDPLFQRYGLEGADDLNDLVMRAKDGDEGAFAERERSPSPARRK